MTDTAIYTLGALLRDRAECWPDQEALVFPERRETLAEMNRTARNWAKALIARGVQPGDHVGILLTTRPEFMDILFGIAMAGAVCIPVNARYQPGELAFLIKDADLVCMITTGRVADSLDFGDRLLSALPSLANDGDTETLAFYLI